MIKVTRLDGSELVINSDMIEFVESLPDTIVSLITGKKIIIREESDIVIQKVAEFKRLSSGSGSPKIAIKSQGEDNG